jgi:hypothetical protein
MGTTLDAEATYARNSQESLTVELGTPHLLGDRFLMLLEADYYYDPSQKFFGLGNNHILTGLVRGHVRMRGWQ